MPEPTRKELLAKHTFIDGKWIPNDRVEEYRKIQIIKRKAHQALMAKHKRKKRK